MGDKINVFLLKIKKLGGINESTYNNLRASGSGPGTLPKIHIIDFSTKFQFRQFLLRLTLLVIISEFLVPLLTPFRKNKYTVCNFKEFSDSICSKGNA